MAVPPNHHHHPRCASTGLSKDGHPVRTALLFFEHGFCIAKCRKFASASLALPACAQQLDHKSRWPPLVCDTQTNTAREQDMSGGPLQTGRLVSL